MSQEVGHGHIQIDVRDDGALAALRRLDNEFERSMDKIRREKGDAEVKLKLDAADFEQGLKNARRQVKKLEGEIASAKVGADTTELKKALRKAKAELKSADGLKAEFELTEKGSDEVKKAIKEIRELHDKELRLIEKRAEKAEKIQEQSAKRIAAAEKKAFDDRQRWVQQKSRSSKSLRDQEARENKERERENARAVSAALRSEDARQREIAQIPAMRAEYVKLAQTLADFDRKRRDALRTRDPLKVTKVDVDNSKALAKFQELEDRLARLGQQAPEINVRLGRTADFGREVRESFDRGGTGLAFYQVGVQGGSAMLDGFKSKFNRQNFSKAGAVAAGGNALSAAFSGFGRLAAGLSSATVRIGPFTATIRQALVGLSALGPIIVNIVGALGSLVGVVGSAGAGIGALGAGIIGGAIPAMLGFVGVIRPVAKQFGAAMKASKAYQDALMKGKTDLAAKKLKELQSVLGNVDKETVKNFKNAGGLAKRWEKLTAPGRASAFKVIGDGLKLAGDNMGWFSRQTNRGMEIAQKSISRMIKGLGSKEGKNILGSMMSNFNSALGPALDGVANLGVYLGRVGRIASGWLPGFASQFKMWSQGVADGASNADALGQKIRSWMESLKSVGRFLKAGGNLLKTFFGGGTEAGRGFLNTMTAAMNRWTQFLRTAKGQESLKEFFTRSVNGAQSLYQALAPIIAAFVSWASALSPVVSGFLSGAGAITSFIGKILQLTALRGPVTALAATLGALWAVSRISAAATAVGTFTRAMLGLTAASTGATALGAGLGAATARAGALGVAAGAAGGRLSGLGGKAASSTGRIAATGAAAGVAGQKVGMLRGAATKLVPSIAGMGAVAGGAATLGLVAVGGAAVYGANKFLTMDTAGEKARNSMAGLASASGGLARAFQQNALAGAEAGSQFHSGKLQLKALRTQLDSTKKGTTDHQIALMQYRDQVRNVGIAERNWTQSKAAQIRQSSGLVKSEEKRAAAMKKIVKEAKEGGGALDDLKAAVPFGFLAREGTKSGKEIEKLRVRYQALAAAAERAKNRSAALPANLAREYRGMMPVLGKAEQSLGRLARQGGKKLAQKIAVKYEAPKDVGRVSAAAGRALKAGVPKKLTTKIAVNSGSADQAVARLQKARIKAISFKIVAQGGNTAQKWINRLKDARIKDKIFKILGQDTSAKTKIKRLIAMGIPPKIAKMLGNNADALNKARQANAQKLKTLQQFINRLIGADESTRQPPSLTQVIKRIATNLPGLGGGGRRGKSRAAGGTFADGGLTSAATGTTGATPNPERIRRAYLEAERNSTRDIRPGGRVTKPTLLAGEENRTEFVIATNPRYKERSKALLAQAARALGMKADGDELREKRSMEGLTAAAGGAPGAQASKRPRRGGGKRPPPGKKLKLKGVTTPSMKKVQEARADEDKWNREGNLLESRIDTPDTFLRVIGKDPATGDPIYDIDQGVLSRYLQEMGAIRYTYVQAQAAVKRLQDALGKAMKEGRTQVGRAKANLKKLEKEKRKFEGLSRSKDKATARHARERLSRYVRPEITRQKEKQRNAESNIGTMSEENVEAAWRYRESVAKIAEYDEDIAAVSAGAQKEKADANPKPGDTTAGGAGDQLSYGAQVAAADAEKAAVLRDFASNAMSGAGPKAAGAASTDPAASSYYGGGAGGAMAAVATPYSPGSTAGSVGFVGATAAGGSTSGFSGASAAGSLTSSGGGSTEQVVATGGGNTFTQINNFEQPPPDPHTWSKGTEYEMGMM